MQTLTKFTIRSVMGAGSSSASGRTVPELTDPQGFLSAGVAAIICFRERRFHFNDDGYNVSGVGESGPSLLALHSIYPADVLHFYRVS